MRFRRNVQRKEQFPQVIHLSAHDRFYFVVPETFGAQAADTQNESQKRNSN
jgi:hypothetical protein